MSCLFSKCLRVDNPICAYPQTRRASSGLCDLSYELFAYAGGPERFSKIPDRRIDFLSGPAGSGRANPGISSATRGIAWDLSCAERTGDRAPRSFPRTKNVAREADGIAIPFEDACFDPERSRVSIDSLSFIDRTLRASIEPHDLSRLMLSHFVNLDTDLVCKKVLSQR